MNHRNLLSSRRLIFYAVAQASPGRLARNALTFERFYNSIATTTYAGTFAREFGNAVWRHIYDRYLKVSSFSGTVTSIAAERADGQVLPLTPNGSGGFDYPCRNTAFSSFARRTAVVSMSDSSTAESFSTNYD